MEFNIVTEYNLAALQHMAKALRKTIRKKRSRRSHILGILVVILGIILILSATEWNIKTTVTAIATLAIVIALIFEDGINGYIAWKRRLPGLKSAITTFHESGFHSETEIGASDFSYEIIQQIVLTERYLVFILGTSHGQVYDLQTLQGGSMEFFLDFLTARNGLTVERL